MAEGSILSFALGLEASGFTGPLSQASGALKAFAASALGFSGAMAGILAAVEKGAELERLHRRTGESVAGLFELEKGFKAAGLGGEEVSPTLFKMEQALGGVNEMGERTDDVFRRLGLDIRKLKNEDPAQAFKEILRAMGGLNHSGAAFVAASIFGRGEASNMVQLSRSSKELAEGMEHAVKDADLFARNAKTFENLARTLEELKDKTMSFFAGLAQVAAPTLQRLADILNGIDFSALGRKAGDVVRIMEAAFEQGKLSELIGDAMQAGIEQGSNFFLETLAGWGAAIEKVFANAISGAASATDPNGHKASTAAILWTQAKQVGTAFLGTGDLFAAAFGSEKASDKLAVRLNQYDALEDQLRKQQGLLPGAKYNIYEGALAAFRDGFANAGSMTTHSATDQLKTLYANLHNTLTPFKSAADGVDQGDTAELEPTAPYHSQFTGLEKMGFVMAGLNNPLANDSRTTASNTGRIVQLISQTNELLNRTASATSILPYPAGYHQPS